MSHSEFPLTEELRRRASTNLASKPISFLSPGVLLKVAEGWCSFPGCDSKVEGFKDELSVREYIISGMCQKCQDKFFDVEDV